MHTFKLRMLFWSILCAMYFTSCVNLQAVHSFSAASNTSLKEYAAIGYTFTSHCKDKCLLDSMGRWLINKRDVLVEEIQCTCTVYKTADSVINQIANALGTYFSAIEKLSKKEAADISFEPLKKALTEGTFGSITIDKKEVESYSKIASLVATLITDTYRRKNLIKGITVANEPVQLLLNKLQFIIGDNLDGVLRAKKAKLHLYYTELLKNGSLSAYEKEKARNDYYEHIAKIDSKKALIKAYVQSLKKIGEGHQNLYENRNKLKAKELKEALGGYVGTLKEIYAEIKSLKNTD